MQEKQKTSLYAQLCSKERKKIAVLVDPDKHNEKTLLKLIETSSKSNTDFFLVGGSLLLTPIEKTISLIK